MDLYGTLDQVTSAQAKLAAILNAHAGEWCHDKNWGARVRLQLLPDVASVVIGKKGSTVQRISKDSGAVVRVGNDVDASNLQLCQVSKPSQLRTDHSFLAAASNRLYC